MPQVAQDFPSTVLLITCPKTYDSKNRIQSLVFPSYYLATSINASMYSVFSIQKYLYTPSSIHLLFLQNQMGARVVNLFAQVLALDLFRTFRQPKNPPQPM